VIFKFARPGSVIKQEPRAPIQSQKNSFLVKRMTRGIRSLLRVSEDKVLNLYGECFHPKSAWMIDSIHPPSAALEAAAAAGIQFSVELLLLLQR
jgi:hypothetical protein